MPVCCVQPSWQCSDKAPQAWAEEMARYRTPRDACYVQVQLIAAASRLLPAGITFDVDAVR